MHTETERPLLTVRECLTVAFGDLFSPILRLRAVRRVQFVWLWLRPPRKAR